MPANLHASPQMSVLDRLIDQQNSHRFSVQQLRNSVRRDLENLLNTRRSWLPINNKYPELAQSVLGYGLPDFTVMEMSSDEGCSWLCREIEKTIAIFEPRLTQVKVALRDNDFEQDRILRLRIDAVLLADPLPEPVVFDSELESVNLSMRLRDS